MYGKLRLFGKRIASLTVITHFVLFAQSSPAHAGEFCTFIEQLVADAVNDFRPERGTSSQDDDGSITWIANKMPPGASHCDINRHRDSQTGEFYPADYSCTWIYPNSLSAEELGERADTLISGVAKCLAATSHAPNSFRSPSSVDVNLLTQNKRISIEATAVEARSGYSSTRVSFHVGIVGPAMKSGDYDRNYWKPVPAAH